MSHLLTAVLAFGLFPAVPLLGDWLLDRWLPTRLGMARLPVATALGLTAWSLPLMGLLIARAYHPELLGAAGWVVAAGLFIVRRSRFRLPGPALRAHVLVLAGGLAIAAAIYLLFPADPSITDRDMQVYAQHAQYIAQHGRLDVPYPAELVDQRPPPGMGTLAGLYRTRPTMTVQFGHLYAAWLAQVFAVFGFGGVIRANAVLALLAAAAVFGVCRRLATPLVAALATVALALNPAQIWVTHNTLTEIFTQWLIWTAFLILVLPRLRESRRAAALAGVLLGMSAMVRIDSLVLVPLLLLAHAAILTVDETPGRGRVLTSFWMGAAPVFALSVGYYAAFTYPYFHDLGSQLRLIAALGVAAALVLLLTRIRRVRATARGLVRRPRVLAGLGIGILLVAVYTYAIRPLMPPFNVRPSFAFGSFRTFIENAMWNLGWYVSPPVLWLGVVSWLALLLAQLWKSRSRWLLLLIVTGGYTALYLWNESIFPDQPWAIRRFIPVIIPAVFAFSAAGMTVILRRFRLSLRPVLATALAVLLAAYTFGTGYPVAFTAERAGSYQTLAAFARSLPAGRSYLGVFGGHGSPGLATPLFLAFDTQIVPLDVLTSGGRQEAFRRLAAASPSAPVWVITNLPHDASHLVGNELSSADATLRAILPRIAPLPHTTTTIGFQLVAKEVTGFDVDGSQYGGESSWWVSADGFYDQERFGSSTARWTNGAATVRFPITIGWRPRSVQIRVVMPGQDGNTLTVRVDGTVVGRIVLPPGASEHDLPIPDAARGSTVSVSLESDTFVPADVDPASRDTRRLGVLVERVALFGGPG
ncbi:MAG: hypothetical protein M3P14_10570 [Chloroflexota bacterium]|nr:hypothetical protein [Chloroflexota bacterium]